MNATEKGSGLSLPLVLHLVLLLVLPLHLQLPLYLPYGLLLHLPLLLLISIAHWHKLDKQVNTPQGVSPSPASRLQLCLLPFLSCFNSSFYLLLLLHLLLIFLLLLPLLLGTTTYQAYRCQHLCLHLRVHYVHYVCTYALTSAPRRRALSGMLLLFILFFLLCIVLLLLISIAHQHFSQITPYTWEWTCSSTSSIAFPCISLYSCPIFCSSSCPNFFTCSLPYHIDISVKETPKSVTASASCLGLARALSSPSTPTSVPCYCSYSLTSRNSPSLPYLNFKALPASA